MKNWFLAITLVGALACTGVAHASLVGDIVDFSQVGLSSYNTASATVAVPSAPEFTGVIDGDESLEIYPKFNLGADTILFSVETNSSGFSGTIPNFSVTFGDLDWVGQPDQVLNGVSINFDDPTESLGGTAGQGVSWLVSDHSLQFSFADFIIDDEFREIQFQLSTGEGTPVVPLPAGSVLVCLGFSGVIIRRWIS